MLHAVSLGKNNSITWFIETNRVSVIMDVLIFFIEMYIKNEISNCFILSYNATNKKEMPADFCFLPK